MFLGDAALTHSEAEQARSSYEEAMAVWKDFGDLNLLAYSVRRFGLLAQQEGEYERAAELCKESLLLNQESADQRGILACLASFGAIATAKGNFRRAAVLISVVDSQLASTSIRLLPVDKTEYERNLTRLREELDGKALNKFWATGKEMSLEEAIAFALEENRT